MHAEASSLIHKTLKWLSFWFIAKCCRLSKLPKQVLHIEMQLCRLSSPGKSENSFTGERDCKSVKIIFCVSCWFEVRNWAKLPFASVYGSKFGKARKSAEYLLSYSQCWGKVTTGSPREHPGPNARDKEEKRAQFLPPSTLRLEQTQPRGEWSC